MIGNDVVDLCDADSRISEHHPRFDRRVFHASELALLQADADPERMRWLLWAAKESAFKLFRRRMPGFVFAPSRFIVSLRSPERGSVDADGHRCEVRLRHGRDFVHAVALSESPGAGELCADVATLGPRDVESACGPSKAARRLAIAILASRLRADRGSLEIRREDRFPVLFRDGRRSAGELSLSHHGRFVAFAWRSPLHAARGVR
jgi:phosphopantetheinyl transferase (holo-ACP synthase)